MMDPGSVWYELPLYLQWYHSTLAHNTLVVDERNQVMCGATQLVYAPADTMGMQRASCRDAYPGVIMDRATFMTADYMADLFGAFASLQRKYDLAWHIRGEFASDLKLEPTTLPEPREVGYVALTNVRKAAPSDQAWSATVTREGNVARFLAAGGTQTEVIVGDGHYGLETPPAILERRETAATVYGNVIDISGGKEGYVKSVKQEGESGSRLRPAEGRDGQGHGPLLRVVPAGDIQAGGLETDAQQAFVVMDGRAVKAMYLGGGKAAEGRRGGAQAKRAGPGLHREGGNRGVRAGQPVAERRHGHGDLRAAGGDGGVQPGYGGPAQRPGDGQRGGRLVLGADEGYVESGVRAQGRSQRLRPAAGGAPAAPGRAGSGHEQGP